MPKPTITLSRTTALAPALLIAMLSLTEVTARSVWQYGFGGLAAPAGALLALTLASVWLWPRQQAAGTRSLAHWLSQRSYPALRRPLALVAVGVDITLLSLLLQTMTTLLAMYIPGDITLAQTAAILGLAILFALPQPQADRYRVAAGTAMFITAVVLSAAGAWLGFRTSIDWATLQQRTPPTFNIALMGMSFALATLAIPALYPHSAAGSRPRHTAALAISLAVLATATAVYMALTGIAGADALQLQSASSLLLGLQTQTLARPLLALAVAGLAAGTCTAAWAILTSLSHSVLDDMLRQRETSQIQFLPRALLAAAALLIAQLIATGDSAVARVAIGVSSFGGATLTVPMLYAMRSSSRPMVLVVAWIISAAVWSSAVMQQSPGDPALWAAAAAAIYVALDWLISALRRPAQVPAGHQP